MNANELFFWLRGIFELSPTLTETQISAIRTEVLKSSPVEAKIIPVEVVNPMSQVTSTKAHSDCGCKK